MDFQVKHECGVAMIRLLKPLKYYQEKYGTWQYGLDKLYLLMEKQHNRGQEGAGIAGVNSRIAPGKEHIFRERTMGSAAVNDLYCTIYDRMAQFPKDKLKDSGWVSENIPFAGEIIMGHVKNTSSELKGITYLHPFLRRSSWKSKNLLLCGNFNLTNIDELFDDFIKEGQHPRLMADTFLMLETLGNSIDANVQKVYNSYKSANLTGEEINNVIAESIDMQHILKESSKDWDGGYVICGATGDSHAFAFRDPWGIRSAYFYHDDEVIVVASERPVIQTAFNVETTSVRELLPGQAIIIDHKGQFTLSQVHKSRDLRPCSFERIYFSRGSDAEIYQERKTLGRQLVKPILDVINNDIENTVFSFIPNTSEVAFFGMMEGFDEYLNRRKKELITPETTQEELEKILSMRVRQEKVAVKDIKLRTFITEDKSRDDLAKHVYDITYGSIVPGQDNLVVIDDSIVRGTTLKQSIIKILDRLSPRKIIIVSSAPQIRYPDCYGMGMGGLGEFVAFNAAIELIKDRRMHSLIDKVYHLCKSQETLHKESMVNYVKQIYEPFSVEEINNKIVELLKPESVKTEVRVVFQSIQGLQKACPVNNGDWYFSGNYPTAGGIMFVNKAFISYYEGKKE